MRLLAQCFIHNCINTSSPRSTYFAFSGLKGHGWGIKEEGGCVVVILEAEGSLHLHETGVADSHCLHVLRIAALPIPGKEVTKRQVMFSFLFAWL